MSDAQFVPDRSGPGTQGHPSVGAWICASHARHSKPNGIAPLHVRLLGGFRVERSDVGQADIRLAEA